MSDPVPPSAGSMPGEPEADKQLPPAVPHWQSQQILQGSNEVLIHHDGQVYRLRLTSKGKLILYK